MASYTITFDELKCKVGRSYPKYLVYKIGFKKLSLARNSADTTIEPHLKFAEAYVILRINLKIYKLEFLVTSWLLQLMLIEAVSSSSDGNSISSKLYKYR